MQLHELLKSLRKEKGYSLRDVQNMSGGEISYGYLHLLEGGFDPRSGKQIKPSTDTLKVLARVYNYPYEDLLKTAGYIPAWWEQDKTPTDIELIDFIMNNSNIKLMGDPVSEEAKKDILLALRIAHAHIKQERKTKDSETER